MRLQLSKHKLQVVILYSTTLLGILVGVLSSMINTRFVTPPVFGDVRYIQNIMDFISSFLLLGFFQSGSRLLAISDSDLKNREIKGCMVIILCICILIEIISFIVCSYLHLESDNISSLFLIALPVCYSPLLLNYVNTTAQGDNQIIRLSISRLTPSLIYVIFAYYIYKNTGASAPKMLLLQGGVSVIILTIVIVSTKPLFRNLTNRWIELKNENRNYGFHLYTGSLVMVTTNYLAGISLGAFNSSNAEVGFYTLALSITTPLATLPAIIGTTYFKEFASKPSIPSKILKASILLTVSSCLVYDLLINPIVSFLYPESYSIVGTYAMIMSIGFSMHGFGDMINRFLGSHGEGKAIRNASIGNGLFKIVGFTVLVYFFNIIGAIATVVICDAIYLVIMLYYYHRFTHASN